jgi:hypothetical protein
MARRLEDGSLVFWHTPKGLTFWISAKDRKPSDDPLQEWKRLRSPAASDELVERADGSLRYGYRVEEENVDLRQAAFYGFFLDDRTQFLLAAYFDYEDAIGDVIAGWPSLGAKARFALTFAPDHPVGVDHHRRRHRGLAQHSLNELIPSGGGYQSQR